jgi:hypothetical protein
MQAGLDTENIYYGTPIILSCCRVKLRYPSRQQGELSRVSIHINPIQGNSFLTLKPLQEQQPSVRAEPWKLSLGV